ncbi:MAG: GDSL-type esterase/lipase family protein [Prevotellaceae bacterium]|jgi:lysophospholipase L1-like esterase|nr:GDSL-type esterase/lipase family protein [Prevotellaceae bacterium]
MKTGYLICSFILIFGILGNAQTYNQLINLEKYAKANSELPEPAKNEKRVVFIGNSITQNWAEQRPDFFTSNNYIGRGISGQTSPQLLLRFRRDVIDLKPAAVLINVGTNDIAENTGTYDEDFTLGNIKSMAELAKAGKIKVILSSVTPVGQYRWKKEIQNVPEKIQSLNAKIKAYAAEHKFAYVDYYSHMHNENHALKESYGSDGVHPNARGYEVMEQIADEVIRKVIK